MCAVNRRPILKKSLHLKRIASDTVIKTQNGINVKDILQLVKNGLPSRNSPFVIESSKLLPKNEKKSVILRPDSLRPGTQAFIKILMHSRKCSSCKNPKCKKMKMVQEHFSKCSKNGQSCILCGQLIALLSSTVRR